MNLPTGSRPLCHEATSRRLSGRWESVVPRFSLGVGPVNEKKPTYRVEVKSSGTPPNETYGWEIYRNSDVLPTLRSQQLFVSRMAGLADANRSRLQLVDTDLQDRKPNEASVG
jgi:hypothetical protein